MKHPLRAVAVLVLCAMFVRFGNPCAYAPDEAVFALNSDPDGPYAKYLQGRLGIVQGTYRVRHLVAAYRTLSGAGLNADEQKAALAVEAFYNGDGGNNPDAPALPGGVPAANNGSGAVDRKVPGQDYQSFGNCLSDAFANAAATLADRRARYGKAGAPDTPEIVDWMAGQDAVFSNCAGPGTLPKSAPANAPLWLKQDRAYQAAAAQFYAMDYDNALAGFNAIATDRESPWAQLSRYVVARVLIRKAVVPLQIVAVGSENDINIEKQRETQIIDLLRQARAQLEGILADPKMKPMHRQSRRLLDYVMARVAPAEQARELARRLSEPGGDPDYAHDVIDLTFLYNTQPAYEIFAKLDAPPAGPHPPLTDWLTDLGWVLPHADQVTAAPPQARRSNAIEHWHASHGAEWLTAAMSLSQPGEAGNDELVAATHKVSSESPAYAVATYHRLRLAVRSDSNADSVPAATRPVYDEVAALLPKMAATQPVSTVNRFADLAAQLSPTLDDFLKNATRRQAGWTNGATGASGPPQAGTQKVLLCGVDVLSPETLHLNDQTALLFNQRMPLHMLRDAALSPLLPGNVRFQVAHMAWTRAVLLNDQETARAVSPYLAGCQPAFAEWLDHYNAATTAGERQVLGLLALMRFTSTEPTVRAGFERDFAIYDSFRDNWWCTFDPANAGVPTTPQASLPHLFSDLIVERQKQPDPPFLSAADRSQAEAELAKLRTIPGASDYFAQQALDWVNAHSGDPYNADVIGFAMRVVRNACRSGKTKELNHALFNILHRDYPNSEWAKRYTTWE